MKKIISVFLSIVMLISAISIAASAKEDTVPIIMVSGYGTSQLYLNYGQQDQEKVWTPSMDAFSLDYLQTLNSLKEKDLYAFGTTLGKGLTGVLKKLECNPDGTSVYPLETASKKAEDNSMANSSSASSNKNNDEGQMRGDSLTQACIDKVGAENVFTLQTDFRQGAIDCAKDLRDLVISVKEYTGASKVSLFGMSHGGMVVGTYLSLYGTLGDIDNAVLCVPAIGGTTLAADALTGNIDIAGEDFVEFIETMTGSDSNIARFFETNKSDAVATILSGVINGAKGSFLYWNSIWDFVPTQYYEELKSELLDTSASAALIEKSDKMHYEIMANYSKNFKACQQSGVDISIISGSGSNIVLGGSSDSDIIIDTALSSGAECASSGKRFSDGYIQSGTVCTDSSHNHVSPAMNIDASSAYLPDNTWFVDGIFHLSCSSEEYVASLMEKLLLTDDIQNVYSDKNYPQFEYSYNSYYGIHIKFNLSSPGYVSDTDTQLVIKNLTNDKIKLLSVTAKGMKLTADIMNLSTLEAGEEITVPVKMTLPELSKVRAELTVNFCNTSSLTPLNSRTFALTVMNGSSAVYDESNPYSELNFVEDLKTVVPEKVYSWLSFVGLRKDVSIIYQTLLSIIAKIMPSF